MPAASVDPDWVVGAVLALGALELLLLLPRPPQPATATTIVNAAATAAPVRLGRVAGIEANSYAMSAPAGGSEKLYAMPQRDPRMVHLGYGKWVRADRVYAVVPLEGEERGDRRRTYVHVDGLAEPLVASRSERAILADVEAALAEAAGVPRRRRRAGQDELF